jgi:excisionase family DNA binding protein
MTELHTAKPSGVIPARVSLFCGGLEWAIPAVAESAPGGTSFSEEDIAKFADAVAERLQRKRSLPAQEWLSIEQTEALTGFSMSYIRRAIKSGTLRALKSEKDFRITRAAIEEWERLLAFEPRQKSRAAPKTEKPKLVRKKFPPRNEMFLTPPP